jgi:hypothetical protein
LNADDGIGLDFGFGFKCEPCSSPVGAADGESLGSSWATNGWPAEALNWGAESSPILSPMPLPSLEELSSEPESEDSFEYPFFGGRVWVRGPEEVEVGVEVEGSEENPIFVV